MKKINEIKQLFRTDISLLEQEYLRLILKKALPVILALLSFIGFVVLPMSHGFSLQIFQVVHFKAVLAVSSVVIISMFIQRTRFARFVPPTIPAIFFIIGFFMFSRNEVIVTTPFLPFYAHTTGIVISSFFLNIRHIALYLLCMLIGYIITLYLGPFSVTEFVQRGAILLFISPFVFFSALLRHKNFNEIQAQTQSLVQISRFRTIFDIAKNFAHEINNPLRVISSTSKKLVDKEHSFAPDDQCALRDIVESSQRISDILKTIDEFSQSTKNVPVDKVPIYDLIESSVKIFQKIIDAHNIKFGLNDDLRKYHIEGNRLQIEQVFMNLISYAVNKPHLDSNKFITFHLCNNPAHDKFVRILFTTNVELTFSENIEDNLYSSDGDSFGFIYSLMNKVIRYHGGLLQVRNERVSASELIIQLTVVN